MPVNGNYAPHQGYGGLEPQQNNYAHVANNNNTASQAGNTNPPPTSTTPASTAPNQQSDIPKDEVGWYFVEQYYTTLSRSPEKLYLFYNKRSQLVTGQEAEKIQVCVGQRAINDKIKAQEFQDCKVRVTIVDSQASDTNIVIQVIGEISNKSQPHKKFTQTFVLATQTNGYFVLNDIFRYLIDEEDEPEAEVEPVAEEVQQAPAAESGFQEPVPTLTEVEPKTLTSSMDPITVEHDAQQVDKELQQKVLKDQSPVEESAQPDVNGVSATEPEAKEEEDTPAAANVDLPEEPVTDSTSQAAVPEEEKPKDPEPTPSASPPKEATPQPAPAPKPAAPKTWASLAASANRVATPNTPSTASSASSSTAKPTSAAARTTAVSTSTGTTASAAPAPPAVPQAAPTAPARQTNQQQAEPQYRGYIKNVSEGVDYNELKAKVEEFGEVTYFDISRMKVC